MPTSVRILPFALLVFALTTVAVFIPHAVYADASTTVVTFLTPGSTTWTVPSGVTFVDYLVVAGGGGGGGTMGGGGGAGGVKYATGYAVTPGNVLTVVVGAGGSGSTDYGAGYTGSNSVFDTITAHGGGAGGANGFGGGNGGSGGGSGESTGAPGTGTVGEGNDGGASVEGGAYGSGGGGGAGAAGAAGTTVTGGNGGDGVAYSISGSSTYYGGGGGGGSFELNPVGSGGLGGGGNSNQSADGSPGTANTGGGGGGGGHGGLNHNGGAGGSGIVIIKYQIPFEHSTVTLTKNTAVTGGATVLGALSKGSGTFVIDHPLDPKNKLLYHSFVESPDVLNIYDGIATLDESGKAVVTLPRYFFALNKDFQYLATPIGVPMPDLHLSAVAHYRFWLFGQIELAIAGGVPNGKVSWQITGVRHDPFITANPIIPEVEKGPDELVDKGEYLFPELYEK